MGSSWEILKDLIRFFRIKEVPDIDVGRAKLSEFRDNYRFPSHVSEFLLLLGGAKKPSPEDNR
jgi:hypothetical protein